MIKMNEHGQRITGLKGRLALKGLGGALLTAFTDIYYFTGTRQNSVLWVPASGPAVLLARKSFSRAKEECPWLDVRPFASKADFSGAMPAAAGKTGLVFNGLNAQSYKYYSGLMPGAEFSDIAAMVRELRSVKSPAEQDLLRESAKRLSSVFALVPGFLKPGMSELEAGGTFEYHSRLAGNEGCHMRAPIGENFIGVAVSGASAGRPGYFDGAVTGPGLSPASPVGASLRPIEKNSPVFLDYTFMHAGYISDMTRIFVFGKLPEQLVKAYATSLEIHRYIAENLRPGNNGEALYQKALELAAKAGLGDNFMGAPGEQARFVGHGLGLELDEIPVLCSGFKAPFEPGNVVAVEPKFIFPGLGAVGIENTFIIGSDKAERITSADDEIIYL